MIERFNGRISDVMATRRYKSMEGSEQMFKCYCWLCDHGIQQKSLHRQPPIAAMKN
ncbi:hypothetical protein ACUN9Y_08260 [Halomonas sp. V046]|uniref:hypothetical protein n=1 Tax=Halomonas sp. V046 TaxID=3459611 RepID=UPI004043AFF3